ncbi:LysR family transcriptional regulator [Neobacillus novalis]|uniref:LysR family transcriptional regulator n=1 Tax=Neobacillus novalis TaxID=220687 RepID=A0AA95SE34_9BACI|nr:LysR family transcriptional regulator [Neobacillus novalis]WHY83951.1 LysR family transcriptional regulator [Neobacillus novalis]
MNIEQLSYVVEVANSKSLLKAANNLHVTESAISQAIKRLEDELNVKIFNRTQAGFVPTERGREVVNKAIHALQAIDHIRLEASKQMITPRNCLRISTITELTNHINDIMYHHYKKNPSLNIEVTEQSSQDTVRDLRNDLFDIGFIVFNRKKLDLLNEFDFTPIHQGKFNLLTSNTFQFGHNIKVNLVQFKNEKFVLYKDPDIQELMNEFQTVFGPINIIFKTKNIKLIERSILDYGAFTIGHSLFPFYSQSPILKKSHHLDLGNFLDTSFQFGWIKKKEHTLSREANLFIKKINVVLSEFTPVQ